MIPSSIASLATYAGQGLSGLTSSLAGACLGVATSYAEKALGKYVAKQHLQFSTLSNVIRLRREKDGAHTITAATNLVTGPLLMYLLLPASTACKAALLISRLFCSSEEALQAKDFLPEEKQLYKTIAIRASTASHPD